MKLNLTQDGRINAVISADRSDTLNMLKQDSGTLQQSLRDAGLNADSSSLSFNLRGDAPVLRPNCRKALSAVAAMAAAAPIRMASAMHSAAST